MSKAQMCRGLATLLAAATLAGFPAMAQIVSQNVQFPKGTSSTTIRGSLKGDVTRDYVLRASAGQTMTVSLHPTNTATYFNVLPPGSQEALFIGSTSGDRYTGQLPASGAYTVRVYLMRSAARRGEVSSYTLSIGVTGHAGGGGGGGGKAPIADLTGMDAVRAIDMMGERGFANVDTITSGNTIYGIYYLKRTGQCVQMTMADNHVADISDIHTHPRCR